MTADPEIRTYRAMVCRLTLADGRSFLLAADDVATLNELSEPWRAQRELDPALCRDALVLTSGQGELPGHSPEISPPLKRTPRGQPETVPALPDGLKLAEEQPVSPLPDVPPARNPWRPRKETPAG